MFEIASGQFEEMAAAARKKFLLEAVSEFFALFELCYGEARRLSFERAWEIADYLLDELEEHPRYDGTGLEYRLIHVVLQAAEKGASPGQLRQGLAAFFDALPAHEAGFILFDSLCSAAPRAQAGGGAR